MALDFKKLKRPAFAIRPAENNNQGAPTLIRADNPKRLAALAAAGDIINVLPKPGESLHALMTGRYDFAHVLVAVIQSRVETVSHLRVATLSFSLKNLAEILALVDSKKVEKFSFIFSLFFKEHSPEGYQAAALAMRERSQRFAAPRSHAKVVCLEWSDGSRWTIEVSANLRSSSNQEQIAIFTDPTLHDWHASWIDAMIDKYETTENGQEEV